MDLRIYKDKRANGKFYHKVPVNTLSSYTKAYALKEITKYIEMYSDFGCMNYLNAECNVITKLDPYTTYVYEDLY
jgi:glycine betaine/choline ABC-type transport system substrate-binding protein